MEKEIHKIQISILNTAKKYLQYCERKGVKTQTSPNCDFVTWANCLGRAKLLLLSEKKIISINYLKNLIFEFFGLGFNSNYSLYSNNKKIKNNINIVYSYCTKKNFKKNGLFYDYYFNSSSKNKKIIWFLISLDNYLPKKTNNIFILYKKKKKFNFAYFIKFVFKNMFKKNIIHNLNSTSNTADIFSRIFDETFKNLRFNLYLPYESRPHQNAVINAAKKISTKNKIFGFYHRMPEPIQTEMIYKKSELDKLYVSSEVQKKIFCKYYDWPKKKIYIINSLRYKEIPFRKNFIFLPFEFKNKEFLLRNIKLLISLKKMKINNFKFSIHPLKKESKIHIDFINEIKKIIKSKNLMFNSNLDAPIVLGEPGGTAAELLQTIGKVYHITDHNFDIFSHKIWQNIKLTKLSPNILDYRKVNKQKFINLERSKNSFNKLLSKNKILN
jgi:hypothetical protein